jgi:hypothetical protein
MITYGRGVTLALAATAVLATGGAISAMKPKGEVLPLAVVDRYLTALEQKDATALSLINSDDYQSDKAIQEKLARWGGHKIEKRQVFRTRTSTSADAVRLKIYGSYQQDGQAKGFVDSIDLIYRKTGILPNAGARWQLAIGDLKANTKK